jgi:FtsP/CotA-like multicopper oxidase with cupredoxin domain
VRLPNAMDGVPHHTQPEVQPGERFDYSFVVPDAGLYWYHPHVMSAVQVGSGLYGALLVEDPSEPAELGDELVLVLSDIAIDERGALRPGDEGGDLATLFGREGEVILVNGRVQPTLRARAGLRQRWRIVNAAKSRYFQLALDRHTFTRIGGDGGLLPEPIELGRVVLAPGERADVLVTPRGEPGSRLGVRWIPYDRGYGSTEYREPVEIFDIQLDPAREVAAEPEPPRLARRIAPLEFAGANEQRLELTQATQAARLELGINGQPSWSAPPLQARLGETQVWTVHNTIDWAHPFHLHGYFFQVLDINGSAPPRLEWKDTVDVPVDATVRLAIHFDERPGMWMFHCHVLDHADAGMMGMIHVTK